MIFKQKVCSEERKNGWMYIDGLKECTTFFDKKNNCMCIDLTADKGCILGIHSEAYLLNDFGKTIEKIHA